MQGAVPNFRVVSSGNKVNQSAVLTIAAEGLLMIYLGSMSPNVYGTFYREPLAALESKC